MNRSLPVRLVQLLVVGLALSASVPGLAGAAAEPGAKGAPVRLVTVGGAVTEIVYALGAGEQIVGVDTSSVYPDAATRLPQVGYQRTLSAEGILSLEPTLVLLSDEAGPPAVIEQLTGAKVPLINAHSPHDAAGAARRIREIGAAIDRTQEAEALASKLEREMEAVRFQVESLSSRPRALFLYSRAAGTASVSGVNTAADAMLRLAGAENAAAAIQGNKPLTPEAAVTLAPDVIVAVSRGLETLGGQEALWNLPGLALTPAGKNRRLVVIDDLEFLGFGPRTGEVLAGLVRSLRAAPAGAAAQ